MSENQSAYTQQQPPPPGYYQQPPPKKKHTVRNVILVILGLMILAFAGCMALLGGVANEVDKAIKEEEANDKPVEVSEGEAFTHDGYEAEAGWKVVKERFGGATIKGLRVTNTSDGARTALLTFRFYSGNENLAEVECSSNEIQTGEASKLDCISMDSGFPKGYDTIKVSDFW
ncbi:MAG TPA: hypothetical protein VLA97_18705 [Nocardioidaceae bacterium]|nr:hypothetical protein [Nocardioidaceae bacterium]